MSKLPFYFVPRASWWKTSYAMALETCIEPLPYARGLSCIAVPNVPLRTICAEDSFWTLWLALPSEVQPVLLQADTVELTSPRLSLL